MCAAEGVLSGLERGMRSVVMEPSRDCVRVACVGQHDLLMGSMISLLTRDPRFRDTSRVLSPKEALDRLTESPADVVLLDADMAGGRTLALAQALSVACPHQRLIFVSAGGGDPLLEKMLNAGAVGYIRKDELATSLLGVVQEVAAGGLGFPPQILPRIMISPSGLTLDPSSPPPRPN